MKYYTTTTEYNCGIDLHARQMYACVMDRQGKVLLHCNIEGNDFDYFLKRVAPWRHDLTVVCECTFNWYWLADACDAAAVICKRAHRLITPHAEKLVSKHGTFKGNAILANQIARAGRTTTFHRDILGRVTNQVDNANKSVSYVYDQAGRMTRLIDQGGTPTIWDYDQEGRPTAKIYADGSTNSYTYNALSQLTAKTDAMGRHTHYRYDAVGNLTNIQYQTDAPASFTYDNLNRVVTMLDGVGATEYTYATDCGAVATVTGPFGDVVSYGYDPGKRLTNVMFRGDSRGYTLDPLDRIAAVSALGAEHEYTYLGTTRRLAQLARPNDTLTDYHYDGLGRLTNLVHREPGGGVLSSFGYALDNADQRTQVRREDGFQIDYDYDPVGQLVAAEGSEPGWQFGYQYDERGNPLRREHSGFVHSNSFNTLNQQAESLWSGGAVVLGAVNTTNAIIEINSQPAFAWGLEGMLVFGATNLAVQAGSNEFVAVVSDIFGRSDTNAVTVNVQDQAFAYDLNGNLTNDGVRAYSWDEADRLIEVRDLQTSDVLVQNRYDGLSRRRERIQLEDGILVTKRYVYDGWLVVAVLDGDNEVLEQYVHGVDLSGTREGAGGIGGVLQAVGDEVAYYHYDGSGNVISATDSNAVVMTRLEYDPFGRVLVADGSYTPRYQFSSKEYDTATELNYYGFRYYSPELGRWLAKDPILFGGGQANLYLYCHGDPVNWIDPLGLGERWTYWEGISDLGRSLWGRALIPLYNLTGSQNLFNHIQNVLGDRDDLRTHYNVSRMLSLNGRFPDFSYSIGKGFESVEDALGGQSDPSDLWADYFGAHAFPLPGDYQSWPGYQNPPGLGSPP